MSKTNKNQSVIIKAHSKVSENRNLDNTPKARDIDEVAGSQADPECTNSLS